MTDFKFSFSGPNALHYLIDQESVKKLIAESASVTGPTGAAGPTGATGPTGPAP